MRPRDPPAETSPRPVAMLPSLVSALLATGKHGPELVGLYAYYYSEGLRQGTNRPWAPAWRTAKDTHIGSCRLKELKKALIQHGYIRTVSRNNKSTGRKKYYVEIAHMWSASGLKSIPLADASSGMVTHPSENHPTTASSVGSYASSSSNKRKGKGSGFAFGEKNLQEIVSPVDSEIQTPVLSPVDSGSQIPAVSPVDSEIQTPVLSPVDSVRDTPAGVTPEIGVGTRGFTYKKPKTPKDNWMDDGSPEILPEEYALPYTVDSWDEYRRDLVQILGGAKMTEADALVVAETDKAFYEQKGYKNPRWTQQLRYWAEHVFMDGPDGSLSINIAYRDLLLLWAIYCKAFRSKIGTYPSKKKFQAVNAQNAAQLIRLIERRDEKVFVPGVSAMEFVRKHYVSYFLQTERPHFISFMGLVEPTTWYGFIRRDEDDD